MGPQKSGYFEGVFRTEGLKESTEATTRLNLRRDESETFPLLLDFVYTGKLLGRTTTPENGVALSCLADYLLLESLKNHMEQSVPRRINSRNVVNFYKAAVSLGNEATLDSVADFWQGKLSQYNGRLGNRVPELDPFLNAIDPSFFLSFRPSTSIFGGTAACLFKLLQLHRERVNSDLFCELVKHAFPECMSTRTLSRLFDLSK